jgi:trans-aconitate methyltransferase
MPWLRFHHADATTWTGPGPTAAPYDVVQSGFGVFFLPDMDADSRRLTRLLRPGGWFAVMTWRNGALADYARTLTAAVEHVRGEPVAQPAASSASTRIDTAGKLNAWLTSLGLTDVATVEIPRHVPLDAELAWLLVLGTGFRGLLTGLDDAAVTAVRTELPHRLDTASIHHLDTSALVGLGRTPSA